MPPKKRKANGSTQKATSKRIKDDIITKQKEDKETKVEGSIMVISELPLLVPWVYMDGCQVMYLYSDSLTNAKKQVLQRIADEAVMGDKEISKKMYDSYVTNNYKLVQYSSVDVNAVKASMRYTIMSSSLKKSAEIYDLRFTRYISVVPLHPEVTKAAYSRGISQTFHDYLKKNSESTLLKTTVTEFEWITATEVANEILDQSTPRVD